MSSLPQGPSNPSPQSVQRPGLLNAAHMHGNLSKRRSVVSNSSILRSVQGCAEGARMRTAAFGGDVIQLHDEHEAVVLMPNPCTEVLSRT